MKTLDSVLQKLQHQPPWNVPQFQEKDGRLAPVPWYDVTGDIVYSIAIRDADLETQIEELTAQIQFWGRLEGICGRAVEWHERQLRVWKGRKFAEHKAPPVGEDLKGWKKPTDKEVEGRYRVDSEYGDLYDRIEQAKEALTATKYVREAFQIKAQMAKQFIRRSIDDGRARVSV